MIGLLNSDGLLFKLVMFIYIMGEVC